MVMSDADKRLTAYHEAGHAIVGRLVPEHDPVHEEDEVFLGRSVTPRKNVSQETASQIDADVWAIISRNYDRAKNLLTEH